MRLRISMNRIEKSEESVVILEFIRKSTKCWPVKREH